MFFDYISCIIGTLKIIIFKLIYVRRIRFSLIPKINNGIMIAIKGGSSLNLGRNVRIRNNASVRIYNNGIVDIGNNCFFNDNMSINCQEKIIIGNNFFCGPDVKFIDNDHDYKNNINDYKTSPIVIGENVWIGANCIILKGVNIGDNVVVAAGSIVNKDIPSNTMFYNERAIKIKYLR